MSSQHYSWLIVVNSQVIVAGVLGGAPLVTMGGAFTRSHSKAAIDMSEVVLLL